MKGQHNMVVLPERDSNLPLRNSTILNKTILHLLTSATFIFLTSFGTYTGIGLSAQTNFGPQKIIIESEVNGLESVHAADLDRDGDLDVLSASREDDKIAWYENLGNKKFGPQQIISREADYPHDVMTADLDGDGDMDVLSATYLEHEIAWYENLGSGLFGPQQIIAVNADNAAIADVDGDGDPDVAGTSYEGTTILWYANDGQGHFGPQQPMAANVKEARSIITADLDNDGKADFMTLSGEAYKISWYKNKGNGQFGPEQFITEAGALLEASATDMDGDGDTDVFGSLVDTTYNLKVGWLENDGKGNFGPMHIFASDLPGPLYIYAADWDKDGDQDVHTVSFMAFAGVEVALHVNMGNGIFEKHLLDFTGGGQAFDLDNDGDPDILCLAGTDKISWLENDGNANFETEHIISYVSYEAFDVYAADLDQDGDLDVLSASGGDHKIAWYENKGNKKFGPQNVITTNANWATSVHAADLDEDGDQDVLSTSFNDHKLAWYENEGMGRFGNQNVIAADTIPPLSMEPVDINNDGHMDVLLSSSDYGNSDEIAWYQNDGHRGFTGKQLITTAVRGVIAVYAVDLDSDRDADVIAVSLFDNQIIWFENNGSGSFGAPKIIASNTKGFNAIYASDMDQDGDNDVLSASYNGNNISWYENDGKGNFGKITTASAKKAIDVLATDLDNDGDQDVLAASYDDKITWYANNGKGQLSVKKTISTDVMYPSAIYAADLDNDGDTDVLSASFDGKIAWYENLLEQVGIADLTVADKLFTLYPNPSGNSTHLEINADAIQYGDIEVRITNVQGVMVWNQAGIKTNMHPMDLPQVPSGLYFVSLCVGNKIQSLPWVVLSGQ